MHDDGTCLPDVVDDFFERQVLGLDRTVRPNGGGSVLDDELLVEPELVDRAQHAVERRFVGADGDEDHGRANTFPA